MGPNEKKIKFFGPAERKIEEVEKKWNNEPVTKIRFVVVIVGTKDAPLQDSLMLARGIPGSWVVQIRDAGHGLMYQYPSEFNRAVITFLEDNHEHE